MNLVLFLIAITNTVVIGTVIGEFTRNAPVMYFLGVWAFPFIMGILLTRKLLNGD